jgi:hypothetical protein
VKNRFQSLPFKCNLHRYSLGGSNNGHSSSDPLHATRSDGGVVGRCSRVDSPCPIAERRLVPRRFQPLHLSSESSVLKRAFLKMAQLAPLRRGHRREWRGRQQGQQRYNVRRRRRRRVSRRRRAGGGAAELHARGGRSRGRQRRQRRHVMSGRPRRRGCTSCGIHPVVTRSLRAPRPASTLELARPVSTLVKVSYT